MKRVGPIVQGGGRIYIRLSYRFNMVSGSFARVD